MQILFSGHKAVWSLCSRSFGSHVCRVLLLCYQVVFDIADTSSWLWMEAGRGTEPLHEKEQPSCHTWALICVTASHWCIPHITHTQRHTLGLGLFFLYAFPLIHWLHLRSHPPLTSVVNSLDLENLWCHDFTWWKRTCSSLSAKISPLSPAETFYLSFSETPQKACESSVIHVHFNNLQLSALLVLLPKKLNLGWKMLEHPIIQSWIIFFTKVQFDDLSLRDIIC